MELYKFINENEIKKYKGGFVVVDNRIYTNPKEETVKKAGYKELADNNIPEYDTNKEYLETFYEDGEFITPVYVIKKIEVESND